MTNRNRPNSTLATMLLGACALVLGCSEDTTSEHVHDQAIVADAGAPVSATCSGTDAITQLLCGFTQTPASTGGAPDLSNLLQGAGSLASLLGGTTASTTTQQPSLEQLVSAAGGIANISTLLNGGNSQAAANPLAALLNGLGLQAPTQAPSQPSLFQLLAGLFPSAGAAPRTPTASDGFAPTVAGPRDASVPTTTPFPLTTDLDCEEPTAGVVQFFCMLQQWNGDAPH